MMPPGHIAATWGIAYLAQQNNKHLAKLDYRWLAVAAMAPDIIDKPLAILAFPDADTTQLIAHSFVVGIGVIILSLLFWRGAVPYALACGGHILADRVWNHPESFWWPFYGWDTFWAWQPIGTAEQMVNIYLDILVRYPHIWVVELLALGFLGWLGLKFALYRWPILKQFLLTGHLPPREAKNPATTASAAVSAK